jgi:hypothetical protein
MFREMETECDLCEDGDRYEEDFDAEPDEEFDDQEDIRHLLMEAA